jgi:hypothetical protein
MALARATNPFGKSANHTYTLGLPLFPLLLTSTILFFVFFDDETILNNVNECVTFLLC